MRNRIYKHSKPEVADCLPAHIEIVSEFCYMQDKGKFNLDCYYTFPIDLTPNRIPFGAKSIGKV